jgi:hypothetical protein
MILHNPTFKGGSTTIGTHTATAIVKSGGTSSQFLKADGSVDSSIYSTTSHNHSGVYAPYSHNHNDLYYTKSEVAGLWATKEDLLGNPSVNGYVLSSTTGGTRSWINPTSIGATNLIGLSDVSLATPTNKHALFGNGSTFASRALVENDISNFGSYSTTSHNHSGVYSPYSHNHSGVYDNFGGFLVYANGSYKAVIGASNSMDFVGGTNISVSYSLVYGRKVFTFNSTGGSADGNDYVDTLAFNTVDGVLTLGRTGALGDLTYDLDGRYSLDSHNHSGVYEPVLGFTPYNSTNPSGYTSNDGTVTTVNNGNGMDFTSFGVSGTIELGLPSSCSGTSTNQLFADSHRHSIATGPCGIGGVAIPNGGDVYDFVIGLGYVTSSHNHSGDYVDLTTSQSVGGAKTFTSAIVCNSTATATDFIGTSDRRYKKEIKELKYTNIISDYKSFKFKGNGQVRYGIIAQELQKYHPEFVREDDNGFLAVSYLDLHSAEIQSLKDRVEHLESLIKNK